MIHLFNDCLIFDFFTIGELLSEWYEGWEDEDDEEDG